MTAGRSCASMLQRIPAYYIGRCRCDILSGDWFCAEKNDSYHKKLELLIGTESELHSLVTHFAKSAILFADKLCLAVYISSDGHLSVVYLYCLVIALKPGRVAQLVGHLTRKSGVLSSIPGLATYFRFSFR